MAKRVLSRLRAEDGFGIIELSIAMVMLNIGLLAIMAAFNSGAVALARANLASNATVIADKALEAYRGYRNCQIYLDPAANGGIPTSGTYTTDSAYSSTQITKTYPADDTTLSPIDAASDTGCSSAMGSGSWTCPATPTSAQLSVTAHDTCYTGPDGRTYIVDTYITAVTVSGGGLQKKVTVVVRDPNNSTGALVREATTFDPYDAP